MQTDNISTKRTVFNTPEILDGVKSVDIDDVLAKYINFNISKHIRTQTFTTACNNKDYEMLLYLLRTNNDSASVRTDCFNLYNIVPYPGKVISADEKKKMIDFFFAFIDLIVEKCKNAAKNDVISLRDASGNTVSYAGERLSSELYEYYLSKFTPTSRDLEQMVYECKTLTLAKTLVDMGVVVSRYALYELIQNRKLSSDTVSEFISFVKLKNQKLKIGRDNSEMLISRLIGKGDFARLSILFEFGDCRKSIGKLEFHVPKEKEMFEEHVKRLNAIAPLKEKKPEKNDVMNDDDEESVEDSDEDSENDE